MGILDAPITPASIGALPRWKPNTAYTAGQQVANPNGSVVTALTSFTSGATYDGSQWSTPFYAVAAADEVYNANKLNRWFAALGDAQYGVASIAVVGDSIATGAYSNNVAAQYTAADEPIFATRGWVGLLRGLFAAQYGDPGEGMILNSDKRVTYSGGAASNTTALGFHANGTQLSSGSAATVTVTLPACVAFDILMWTPYGASASFTYTVDGGAPITAAASPATQNTAYAIPVTGLANATHTLVVNAPASGGSTFWYGVKVKSAQSTGVQVHRLAKSGAKTPDALNIGATDSFAGTGAVPARTYKNMLGPVGANADLVVIALGSNDAALNSQNVTPAMYKANLQSIITYITGTLNKCVLLYSDPRRPVPNGFPYAENDYYAAMKQLSDENNHVAYLDVLQSFGTYEQASTTDINRYADLVHPNRRGHGLIARTIHRALTIPARYPGT